MSFILKTSKFAAARSVYLPSRAFGSTSLKALKESDRNNPDLAEQNDKHKQDGLQKQKDGKGHWKPELASDSEEAVAADRHEHADHSEEGLKELQKKTAEHAEKKHKYGTSQDAGL